MSLPQAFIFNGAQLRMVEKDGQPWFVLKDVCDVLALRAPDVKQRLSDDVVSTHTVEDSLGRANMASIINEDGLYDVILESRKPEAKAFRKWVTGEVLPSIRKTGGYAVVPQSLPEALRLAADLAEQKAALEQRVLEERPKVLFADAVTASKTSILVGDLAKLLKQNGVEIGPNRLFIWMRDNGYLISRKGTDYNMPTQRSMELGLFQIKETSVTHSDGHITVNKTPKVSGKGQVYFINKFEGVYSNG